MQTEEPRRPETDAALQTSVATIVAAYVGKNQIEEGKLPELIDTVATSLRRVGENAGVQPATHQEPAVSIKKSLNADYIICLEDGRKFKSLKRHLRTRYGLTPDEYRVKWGLPMDYPMVAPNYAKERSALAKQMGLGRTEKK